MVVNENLAPSPVQPLSGQGVLRIPRLAAERIGDRIRHPEQTLLKIGTYNVGTMTGKGRELADMMTRRKLDILCVQETRWKGNKARELGDGCKLFYSGADGRGRNRIGIVTRAPHVPTTKTSLA